MIIILYTLTFERFLYITADITVFFRLGGNTFHRTEQILFRLHISHRKNRKTINVNYPIWFPKKNDIRNQAFFYGKHCKWWYFLQTIRQFYHKSAILTNKKTGGLYIFSAILSHAGILLTRDCHENVIA